MSLQATRFEQDTIGKRELPANVLYGINTLRAVENFPISGVGLDHFPDLISALAMVKLAAATANPDPEILPSKFQKVCGDAIVATGRSDFLNQVNSVLCSPFTFRGALDVGATKINEPLKIACAKALAKLARSPVDHEVLKAYSASDLNFGPNYLIPAPFDPRLLSHLAPAVAQAAMDSGVATRPIKDTARYREQPEHHQGTPFHDSSVE